MLNARLWSGWRGRAEEWKKDRSIKRSEEGREGGKNGTGVEEWNGVRSKNGKGKEGRKKGRKKRKN